MKALGFWRARQFHDCWAAVEWRFYERWMHGVLWVLAGGLGLAAAAWSLPDGRMLAGRLGAAALVLGGGLGLLRALGLASLLQHAPDAFLRLIGGHHCPPPQRRVRTGVYLRLMEGGFILLECVALFGLLGLSTTAAASPVATADFPRLGIVLLVYGFFAVTFGGKNLVTALAWARWLRPALERVLEWQCSAWLVATGEWEMTRLGLLRPRLNAPARPPKKVPAWQRLAVGLMVAVAVALAATLLAIALTTLR